MSCLENDTIVENAWDFFCDEYFANDSFTKEVQSKFTAQETWLIENYGKEEDALERVFDQYYNPLI